MNNIKRIRFNPTSGQVRWYGISKLLTNKSDSFSSENPLNVSEWNEKWSATKESAQVVNSLLAIPGVTKLHFRQYEVNITLAPVYDWVDVHEEILSVLQQAYFPGEVVTVEESHKPKNES